MSVVAEVLAIEVGLHGTENVFRGLEGLAERFGAVDHEAMALVKGGLYQVGAALGILFGGERENMKLTQMSLQLEALEGGADGAREAFEKLKGITEQGVFNLEETFAAYRQLKLIGQATSENIKLTQMLAARAGGSGHLEAAARLLEQISGGRIGRVASTLEEMGISRYQLMAEGLRVNKRGQLDEHTSPEHLLEVIRRIAQNGPNILGKIESGPEAAWNRVVFEFKEALASLTKPFEPFIQEFFEAGSVVLEWIKKLNEKIYGIPGVVLVLGLLVKGVYATITGVVRLFKAAMSAAEALEALALAAKGAAAGGAAGAAGAAAGGAGAAGGAAAAGALTMWGAAMHRLGFVIGWLRAAAAEFALPILGTATIVGGAAYGAAKWFDKMANEGQHRALDDPNRADVDRMLGQFWQNITGGGSGDGDFMGWQEKIRMSQNAGGGTGDSDLLPWERKLRMSQNAPPSQRAVRRDDIENQFHQVSGAALN